MAGDTATVLLLANSSTQHMSFFHKPAAEAPFLSTREDRKALYGHHLPHVKNLRFELRVLHSHRLPLVAPRFLAMPYVHKKRGGGGVHRHKSLSKEEKELTYQLRLARITRASPQVR